MEKLVALYKNKEYVAGEILIGNRFSNYNVERCMQFPKVKKSKFFSDAVESLKKRDINVGFIEDGDYYKVFDKDHEAYDVWNLPVCIDMFGEIRLTDKYVEIDFPTEISIMAARKIQKLIRDAIELEEKIYEKKWFMQGVKNKIKESKGIAYFNFSDSESFERIFDQGEGEGIKVLYYSTRYSRSPYYGTTTTYYNMILTIPEMICGEEVDLYVPERLMGSVIGTGARNLKEMCKTIGCRRIKVKAKAF